jgi:hypothetical protein
VDSQTLIAIISAASALAIATVGALVKGAVTQRAGRDEELRGTGVKTYPAVWRLTAAISTWPRADLSYKKLQALPRDLRVWYYGLDEASSNLKESPGGLYLSENARDRYGEMQELIALSLKAADESKDVSDEAYDDLREACSAFRTALTEDLDTRRKRSVWWALMLRRRHRAQAREADRRRHSAKRRLRPDERPAESPRADAS